MMSRFLGVLMVTAAVAITVGSGDIAVGQQKRQPDSKANSPTWGGIEQLSGVTHVPHVCAIVCPRADLAPVGYEEKVKRSDTKEGVAVMTVQIRSGEVRLRIFPDEPKGVTLKSVEISADNKTWKSLKCQDEKARLYGPNLLADGGAFPVGQDGAFVRAHLTHSATKK
jgi:hypothetical protein